MEGIDLARKDYVDSKNMIIEENLDNFSQQLEQIFLNVKSPPSPLTPVLCDGTDETIKLQAILDYAKNNEKKEIKFPSGTYRFTHLDLWGKEYSGIKLIGDQGTVFSQILNERKIQGSYPSPTFARFQKADGLITIDSRTRNTNNSNDSVKNINIEGITFINDIVVNGFDELSHQICAHGVDNLTIKNCSFIGFLGDGICVSGGLDTNFTNAYNSNITISNNYFDGINKDNRQAISIYYCDNFIIKNNEIKNTTRSNMPGAIDIESDNNNSITRNGIITKNKLTNIGGNVGAIALVLRNTNTIEQTNFIVTENVISDVDYPITFIATTVPSDTTNAKVIIEKNNIKNSRVPFLINKINGVVIRNNLFDNSLSNTFSLIGAVNVDILNNIFKSIQSDDGFLIDQTSKGLRLEGNKFINNKKHGITSNTKKILSLKNNEFLASLGSNAIPLIIGSFSADESSSIEVNNNIVDNTYLYNVTLINIMTNYVAPILNTTPDKFPLGTFEYFVTGQHPDVNYPNSKAGNVEVIKKSTSTPQTTIMWFYALDQSDGIYYRRAASTNTWGSWYKLLGSLV